MEAKGAQKPSAVDDNNKNLLSKIQTMGVPKSFAAANADDDDAGDDSAWDAEPAYDNSESATSGNLVLHAEKDESAPAEKNEDTYVTSTSSSTNYED
eukprot:TRINITY_DN9480_c0_g1_i1.p1 TRINITY_DN9480_c0_g1~~TRINITY_DN9480_c0_g1_i1.p1  ORF type:complete len:110 (+),score=38.20 TRINITY_DN9480_c0_g1_i1:40-330(+)